ncbi:MAG TPA: YlmC/YmxH family sporulation protein [Bacillota bacterium]|nr:YlmC/YmxH family sporulation protein [Bacillota bacterium]
MIKLSELQIKEIIVINSGSRLGHISDLEIDPDEGRIIALIVHSRDKKGGLFGKPDELLIYWEQIVTIGADVILVENVQEPKRYVE